MISSNKFDVFPSYLQGLAGERQTLKNINAFISQIRWEDLIVRPKNNGSNSSFYDFYLPDQVKTELKKIQLEIGSPRHLTDLLSEFAGWDLSKRFVNIGVDMGGRVDISDDGIPKWMRQKGLGCKMYRAVLQHEPYLMSMEEKLYENGKLLWSSLMNSRLFYVFFTDIHGYLFPVDKSPDAILEVLTHEVDIRGIKVLMDEDFMLKHREIVLNSGLAPFIV